MTIGDLFDKHRIAITEKVAMGERSQRTIKDYSRLDAVLEIPSIRGVKLKSVGPEVFLTIRKRIYDTGWRLKTRRNAIMSVRSVFNWGEKRGYISNVIRYGGEFDPPGSNDIEIEQEKKSPDRFIEREAILASLRRAKPAMKVAILLGINCGFYPGDSIALTFDHVHTVDTKIPYHDFRRVKNGRARMAVLWPETVAAILDYRSNYRRCHNQSEHTIILTRYGKPHTKDGEGRKVIDAFSKMLDDIGYRTKGVSIGSLRHTYSAVIDRSGDKTMINLTMGHTPSSIQARFYAKRHLDKLPRLKKLADRVHDWLFGKTTHEEEEIAT
jgi:integrase